MADSKLVALVGELAAAQKEVDKALSAELDAIERVSTQGGAKSIEESDALSAELLRAIEALGIYRRQLERVKAAVVEHVRTIHVGAKEVGDELSSGPKFIGGRNGVGQ